MGFMNAIKNELNDEKCLTINGSVGYATSGKKLLDLNFSVTSLRKQSEQEIINKFMDAYYEDPMMAMKWLFYCRDCRSGIGERRLFRVVMQYLAILKPDIVRSVLKLVAEYGRHDDVLCLLDTPVKNDVLAAIKEQLMSDKDNMDAERNISLISKWCASENASSKTTKEYATTIRKYLGMTSKQYRQMLSKMRNYLDVVERKMSAKQWNEINYEAVPSRANLIYNDAFLRNDEERRREYLDALSKGKAKINASVLFPDDIVHKYCSGVYSTTVRALDETLEGLWKALPTLTTENTLVVRDGSGSMVGKPMDVSTAMAIYMAERSTGEFHNQFITFGAKPKLISLDGMDTLREKLLKTYRETDCSNTNIKAVFDLILRTAVNNKMSQADMPKNIVIISDMQFDGVRFNFTEPLFKTISNEYAEYGYLMPRLIFWNVNVYFNNVVPIQQNELGVVLISGYSQNLVKMVMSGETDPYECLVKQLNDKRYDAVEEAVKSVL
ncbi:MAG: DUF2828 family protein [Lachnospira sp.]